MEHRALAALSPPSRGSSRPPPHCRIRAVFVSLVFRGYFCSFCYFCLDIASIKNIIEETEPARERHRSCRKHTLLNPSVRMKLIAIIATAAMAVGFCSHSEAASVSAAKKVIICEQRNNGVVICPDCNGMGIINGVWRGSYHVPGTGMTCGRCIGRGIIRADGKPWSPFS